MKTLTEYKEWDIILPDKTNKRIVTEVSIYINVMSEHTAKKYTEVDGEYLEKVYKKP